MRSGVVLRISGECTSLLFNYTPLDLSNQSIFDLLQEKGIELKRFWKPRRLQEKVLDHRDSLKVDYLQNPYMETPP